MRHGQRHYLRCLKYVRQLAPSVVLPIMRQVCKAPALSTRSAVRVPHSGETTRWMPHSGENASVRMRQDSDGSRIIGNIQLAHKYAMMRRPLTCIAAVTASGFRDGRKRNNAESAGI
jgi:hypothetical protein